MLSHCCFINSTILITDHNLFKAQYHFAYFVKIVDRLKEMSYLKNVSIRGAPYDFRKAPSK